MIPVLALVQPYSPADAARIDVRVGSGAEPSALGLGGVQWEPAINRRPRIAQDLMSVDLDGSFKLATADLGIDLKQLIGIPSTKALIWVGAPITIWRVTTLDDAAKVVEFSGVVKSAPPDTEANTITLNCEVNKKQLERGILTGEFSGGGGIGGDAGKRGTLKPAGWGICENLEPVWFDETNNIGMLDGYLNMLSAQGLYEGRSSMGASVGDYASYAALLAAITTGAIPPGRWGTSITDGLVGLGAPPVGVITCDATFGTNRPGALMQSWMSRIAVPGGSIEASAFSALDTAVARDVRYHTREQQNVDELIERLAKSCNTTPLVLSSGLISVTRAPVGSSIATIRRDAQTQPAPTAWRTLDPIDPVYKIIFRSQQPGRVFSMDEVNYVDDIVDRGLYDGGTTYRQGNLVWMVDGSQWLYINPTPSAGNSPPSTGTSDSFWQQTVPPTTIAAGAGAFTLVPDGTGNIVVTPTSIRKATGTGNWDSAAYSLEAFTGGAFVQFKAVTNIHNIMIGLNADPTANSSYNTLDYAIYIDANGNVGAYESNVYSGVLSTYVAGDRFRIEYTGTKVLYWKNSTVMRTVPAAPGQRLFLDSSFFHVDAQATEISFGSMAGPSAGGWTPQMSQFIYQSGPSSFRKIGSGTSWDAAVISAEKYTGAATCSFSFNETTTAEVAVGLDAAPSTSHSYATIDYCIIINGGGNAQAAASNVSVGPVQSGVTANDLFTISYRGGQIFFLRNGTIFHTITVSSALTLGFVGAMGWGGTNLTNVSFSAGGSDGSAGFNLINRAKCSINGSTITKVDSNGAWDGSVVSTESYRGGAYVTFKPNQVNKAFMIALNSDPLLDNTYTGLDYALYCTNNGFLQVYESNTAFVTTTYAAGDILSIIYDNSAIRYYQNGSLLRTLPVAPNLNLFFDSSFNEVGATASAVSFGPVSAVNMVGFLTNEAVTLQADSAGTVSSFATATGTFKVYNGLQDVTTSCTFSVLGQTGCTVAIGATTGIYTTSAMSADNATATFRATYNGQVIDKVFTLSKSRGGAGGANAKTLTLISDKQTIAFSALGDPVPATQNVAFAVNKQNTTGTVTWQVYNMAGTLLTPVTSYLASATGDTNTMTTAQFIAAAGSTGGVQVVATIVDGASFSDIISIVKVKAGASPGSTPAFASTSACFISQRAIVSAQGAPGWGTGGACSLEGFRGGAEVSCKITALAAGWMVGLNTDPGADSNYTGIDYAIYFNSGGLEKYISGTYSGSLGSAIIGDVLAVEYDGSRIIYKKNGVAVDVTNSVGANITFFADWAFYQGGTTVDEVNFWNNTIGLSAGFLATNPDGTIKTDRVITDSVADNNITTSWYAELSNTLTFPSPLATPKTLCGTVTGTKLTANSRLKVQGQIPFFSSDAIDGTYSYEVVQGASVVASRAFDYKCDYNNNSNEPKGPIGYFSGIAAGATTINMYFTRTTANTSQSIGVRSILVDQLVK